MKYIVRWVESARDDERGEQSFHTRELAKEFRDHVKRRAAWVGVYRTILKPVKL